MAIAGSTLPPPRRATRGVSTPPPPPPSPLELPALVQTALRRLEQVGDAEGQNIFDPRLIAALHPLVLVPAVGVRCAHPECGKGLGWWALYPGVAIVAAMSRRLPKRDREGG